MEEINWVYITKTGSRYYGNPNCGYLRGHGAPVPESSALKLGYTKALRGF